MNKIEDWLRFIANQVIRMFQLIGILIYLCKQNTNYETYENLDTYWPYFFAIFGTSHRRNVVAKSYQSIKLQRYAIERIDDFGRRNLLRQ